MYVYTYTHTYIHTYVRTYVSQCMNNRLSGSVMKEAKGHCLSYPIHCPHTLLSYSHTPYKLPPKYDFMPEI